VASGTSPSLLGSGQALGLRPETVRPVSRAQGRAGLAFAPLRVTILRAGTRPRARLSMSLASSWVDHFPIDSNSTANPRGLLSQGRRGLGDAQNCPL